MDFREIKKKKSFSERVYAICGLDDIPEDADVRVAYALCTFKKAYPKPYENDPKADERYARASRIFEEYFKYDITKTAIAEMEGITTMRVSQIIEKFIRIFRGYEHKHGYLKGTDDIIILSIPVVKKL